MEKSILTQIGARIAERRRQMSLTQENVAEMMEVSVQMISNLERGNKAIRIDNLIRLSQVLNVSTDYILTGRLTCAEANCLSEKISRLSPRDHKAVEALVDCLCGQE